MMLDGPFFIYHLITLQISGMMHNNTEATKNHPGSGGLHMHMTRSGMHDEVLLFLLYYGQ
jgi:hypothetical protein